MTHDQQEANNKIVQQLKDLGLLGYDEARELRNKKLPPYVTAMLQRPLIEMLDELDYNVNQMLQDC